ncbi:MAG: hypothetical protein U9Q19_05425 [Pseudomonadota bacterium]|nr:hypothetical protein [Pseudomonadota bacterium]
MKIEISKKDLVVLDDALERGIDDVEHYLKHGTPEDDIQDEDVLEQVKNLPGEYLRLRHRIADLKKHIDDLPWFTVVLIYPDYLAEQYGEEYFIEAVQASDPEAAVLRVQAKAVLANKEYYTDEWLVQGGIASVSDDFRLVATFDGVLIPVLS